MVAETKKLYRRIMAFWGIEVKPGKPFTHRFDDSKGRLHVSMASLGMGSATMRSVLQCNVGNKSPVFLCSLYPEKSESLQLNLEFEEVDEVIFSVIGPRSVHLSGFYLGGGRFRSLNEESESYGEDIAETDSQRSARSDEDEYEDSFIDDHEPEVFPPSPVSNEENCHDKKLRNRKGNSKRRLRKAYQLSESEEEDCSRPKSNTNSSSAVLVSASEDEDYRPISTYFMNGMNSKNGKQNQGKNANKPIDETPKKRTKDAGKDYTEVKRNTDDSATDGQPIGDLVDKIDERPKKKRRGDSKNEKKNFAVNSSNLTNDFQETKEEQEEAKEEQNEAIEEKETEYNKVKKSKKKKIEKVHENREVDTVESPRLPVEEIKTSSMVIESKKTDAKASQVRTLQNGLVIEELKSGKPDGRVAVSGKKVSVRFVGKLKSTGQVIDSNMDHDLFKFRLGARKVIEGWEIGLEGMHVGEKRRLTVPPQMGYGSEGDGKNIPCDSWLVYEVELVKVR